MKKRMFSTVSGFVVIFLAHACFSSQSPMQHPVTSPELRQSVLGSSETTPCCSFSKELSILIEDDYHIGDTVEDFTLPSPSGDSISLYDYLGQVILIHIWHSG